MPDHEATEPRPTVEPSIQYVFLHLLPVRESEATDNLVDAWDKLEEFLLRVQEKPRVAVAQPTSARSLSAAKYVPLGIGSVSPCNAAFNSGSLKSIGSNP